MIKFSELEKKFKKALKLKNNDPEIYFQYWCLLWEENKFKDAEKYFSKAIELDKKNNILVEKRKDI